MTFIIQNHFFFTRSFDYDLIKLLVLCLYLYSLNMVTVSFSEDASGLFSQKKIVVPFVYKLIFKGYVSTLNFK